MASIFGVATLVFLLFQVLPGDPARMMLDQKEDSEQLALIRAKLGLDKPIANQYLYFLNDISPISIHSKDSQSYTFYKKTEYQGFSFDIGKSVIVFKKPFLRFSYQRDGLAVVDIIANTLPNTMILAVVSILIAFVLGALIGVVSAATYGSWIDTTLSFIASLGMSVPSFFSAIIIGWFFAHYLHDYTHLPLSGSLYEVDDFGEGFQLKIRNLFLPALTLGIRPLAVVSQLMRNSLLEELDKDYILLAKAKGLNRFQIYKNHAFKNALNPVITATSGWFASLLAGSVFVEYIFDWNGIGKELVFSLYQLDLPVVMGCVLVIAILFVCVNIAVDLMYKWLDPRVKL